MDVEAESVWTFESRKRQGPTAYPTKQGKETETLDSYMLVLPARLTTTNKHLRKESPTTGQIYCPKNKDWWKVRH